MEWLSDTCAGATLQQALQPGLLLLLTPCQPTNICQQCLCVEVVSA